MRVALTIAGSDSSGGAGIQADLKTFQALGVFGMSAVTAVTVQNTQKVYDIQEMRPQIVHDQIVCLFEDIAIHAVKIGMVASIPLVEAIARALNAIDPLPPVILDPVMISKSGYALLQPDARAALVRHLFPLARVVTPNLPEAEALLGKTIADIDAMKTAAREISALGAKMVVVKGGHLGGGSATDVLFDGADFRLLENRRIDTVNTHGTGCTFSSAIAAYMARGESFFDAVAQAKTYITGAIENAFALGKGCGPTHHFFDLYRRARMDVG
ncbi:bifunctional hydroxymethylpyrimidine kinase/phosphomethylpyrimidine kinase [uncultured Desulfosarcina sp.]|uniref:bifunctional hydroxymethylpyrimidine kinase/phosphomethylpyrimidine kinase n=1 Tax=uncultured Desulfosarcina sp. TaxID=218289 RepID=UPI0029C9092C|nr:bifunctional hydroxymethylpyrimidine kinase/phosphomethylpyrimidine kinase [uncultured Desulfosarcina sp.]